jgi:hypothetical protein
MYKESNHLQTHCVHLFSYSGNHDIMGLLLEGQHLANKIVDSIANKIVKNG